MIQLCVCVFVCMCVYQFVLSESRSFETPLTLFTTSACRAVVVSQRGGGGQLGGFYMFKKVTPKKCKVELVFPQACGKELGRGAVTFPIWLQRDSREACSRGERARERGAKGHSVQAFLAKALYC